MFISNYKKKCSQRTHSLSDSRQKTTCLSLREYCFHSPLLFFPQRESHRRLSNSSTCCCHCPWYWSAWSDGEALWPFAPLRVVCSDGSDESKALAPRFLALWCRLLLSSCDGSGAFSATARTELERSEPVRAVAANSQ